MEWYVYCKSGKEIISVNIFEHLDYSTKVNKLLSTCRIYEEFEKELESISFYYFYGAYEYELFLLDSTQKIEEKIDVYNQLKQNWYIYSHYIWNFRR